MIGLIPIAKSAITIVALPLLRFILAFYVGLGVCSWRGGKSGATAKLVGSVQRLCVFGVPRLPLPLSFVGYGGVFPLPIPDALLDFFRVVPVVPLPRFRMRASVISASSQMPFPKFWIGIVSIAKAFIPQAISSLPISLLTRSRFRSTGVHVCMVICFFAIAYFLGVRGAIHLIVLGLFCGVAIPLLYADLAIATQAVLCAPVNSKIFSCCGFVLPATRAVFVRFGTWGMIVHSNGLLSAVAHATGRSKRRGGNSFVGIHYTTKEVKNGLGL